jgi:hypothetical protein
MTLLVLLRSSTRNKVAWEQRYDCAATYRFVLIVKDKLHVYRYVSIKIRI